MFVSRIAPRMDRVVGANHPTTRGEGTSARAKMANLARRVDEWTLATMNPRMGRHFR